MAGALTWRELNEALKEADEAACDALRKDEQFAGGNRLGHLLRIHARMNRVRADRERHEIRVAWIEDRRRDRS